MFYYLLYNSSFQFIVDNRLFSTILYGSILYIITHAILNYCSIDILSIINNYFWYIFTLDIISVSYSIYNYYTNPLSSLHSQDNPGTQEDLNVSFNLLKNKINTLFNRNNDLTITHTSPHNTPYNALHTSPHNVSHTTPQQHSRQIRMEKPRGVPHMEEGINTDKKSLSTPISKINREYQEKEKMQTNTNTASTPISLIRENFGKVPEPIIMEDGYSESVAGSDVGSVMDLDDFEKSL